MPTVTRKLSVDILCVFRAPSAGINTPLLEITARNYSTADLMMMHGNREPKERSALCLAEKKARSKLHS
jgi:hypothetical protein